MQMFLIEKMYLLLLTCVLSPCPPQWHQAWAPVGFCSERFFQSFLCLLQFLTCGMRNCSVTISAGRCFSTSSVSYMEGHFRRTWEGYFMILRKTTTLEFWNLMISKKTNILKNICRRFECRCWRFWLRCHLSRKSIFEKNKSHPEENLHPLAAEHVPHLDMCVPSTYYPHNSVCHNHLRRSITTTIVTMIVIGSNMITDPPSW